MHKSHNERKMKRYQNIHKRTYFGYNPTTDKDKVNTGTRMFTEKGKHVNESKN